LQPKGPILQPVNNRQSIIRSADPWSTFFIPILLSLRLLSSLPCRVGSM
jgi:hypothetical protein